MLKMDWPAVEKYRAQRPRPLPRREATPTEARSYVTGYVIAAVVIAVILAVFFIGRWTVISKANDIAAGAIAEAQETQVLAEAFKAERNSWETSAGILATQVDDLESDLTSATHAAELWQKRAENASATAAAVEADNEALKRDIARIQQMKRTAPATTAPATKVATSASGTVWSRSQVESTLRSAAGHYGLTADQAVWVVETGARVAYRESTYRTDARNGQHVGLFQFNDGWATVAERLDPVWSCYRFVRVYAEAGEAGIRRHWAATV